MSERKVKVKVALAAKILIFLQLRAISDSVRTCEFVLHGHFRKWALKMWVAVFSHEWNWKACRLPLPGDFQFWLFFPSACMGFVCLSIFNDQISNGNVYILKIFWPASKAYGHFEVFVVISCKSISSFLPECKISPFTFYNYFDLPQLDFFWDSLPQPQCQVRTRPDSSALWWVQELWGEFDYKNMTA